MNASLHIAATGLRHADLRQRATAHNTSNLTTPSTTVVRAQGSERPDGGVETSVQGRTEDRVHLGADGVPAGSGHGAVDSAVEQIVSENHAASLASVVRTSDDMIGSLLDVLG